MSKRKYDIIFDPIKTKERSKKMRERKEAKLKKLLESNNGKTTENSEEWKRR